MLQCEARRARTKVLTVTVIDETSRVLREEDRNAADVVIYGFPVTRKKDEAPAAIEPVREPVLEPVLDPALEPGITPPPAPTL